MNAHLQQARATANPLSAYPELLAEWHPTRNVGLDPTALARGSHRRAWWRCAACGHEWQTQIHSRAYAGSGCPRCARKRATR
jgi:hypothetical protein